MIATPAAGQDTESTPCQTPQSAINQWKNNIGASNQDRRRRALRCFDWDAAGTLSNSRLRIGLKLKGLLDAQGIVIDASHAPESANDDARVPLHPSIPEVWFHKAHGEWLIAPEAIDAIPKLHDETFTIDVQTWVSSLPSWMHRHTFLGMTWWQLFAIVLLVALGLLLRNLLSRFLAKQVDRFIEMRGEHAAFQVVLDATKPLGTLLTAGFFWYCLPLLQLKLRAAHIGAIAIRVLGAAAGVWLLYRLVDLGSSIFGERAKRTETKLDDQIIPLVRKVLKVFVLALGTIFVLQNLNVDVGSLIAGASLGGLAFSLAAKDTVANFFGSISILADHPFQVDDWVIIGEHQGKVVEVGMRSTRLRTVHDSLVTIPNSIVANAALDNRGARRFRRCEVVLGVSYDTTTEVLKSFISGIEEILENRTLVRNRDCLVKLNGLGDSTLDILLLCFFEVDSWNAELNERQELFFDILRLGESLNVDFAFPTQTIHIESMPKT